MIKPADGAPVKDSDSVECLTQIGQQILGIFHTHREPNLPGRDPGRGQCGVIELAVRGRRRMADLGVHPPREDAILTVPSASQKAIPPPALRGRPP